METVRAQVVAAQGVIDGPCLGGSKTGILRYYNNDESHNDPIIDFGGGIFVHASTLKMQGKKVVILIEGECFAEGSGIDDDRLTCPLQLVNILKEKQ